MSAFSDIYSPSREACIGAAERIFTMMEKGIQLDDAFLNFSRASNLTFIATIVCFMALCHEAVASLSRTLFDLISRGIALLE